MRTYIQNHPIFGKVEVLDLSDKEDHEAIAVGQNPRHKFTPEVEAMIEELIKIGTSPGFLKPCEEDCEMDGVPYPTFEPEEFNSRNCNVRGRAIGEEIDTIGGFRLMQSVFSRVGLTIPEKCRALEWCWNGVGDWQA